MSFTLLEKSIENGRPAFLFKISRTGINWFYTNVDQDIEFLGDNYLASPFSISSIIQSGDPKSELVEITIPSTCPLAVYLEVISPTEKITVSVRKIHMTELPQDGSFTPPLSADDAPIIWLGHIDAVRRVDLISRVLVCNTLSFTLLVGGLRLSWGRNCPHMLYGRGCLVDKASYAVALSNVAVASDMSISADGVSGLPLAYFDGGFIQWKSAPSVTERTGVLSVAADVLTILGSTRGMENGTDFVAYPGCDRTAAVCDSKFGNILNFGGINHMQGVNPFSGSPVF